MIVNISSINNERIKKIYKATRDNKQKLFVIESINVIKEQAYKFTCNDIILLTDDFLTKNKWFNHKLDIIVTNKTVINKISFTKTPPECIVIKKLNIANFKIESNQNYLILDNIKDPGNLATIIRSSVAFGINNFFISKNSVSIYNDKVLRSTMGSIFLIKVNYYNNLLDIIKKLETSMIECVATCIDHNAITLDKYETNAKYHAFVFGNESTGIDKSSLRNIKNKVYIEINNIDSLNVACAASIILYQKFRWDLLWKK